MTFGNYIKELRNGEKTQWFAGVIGIDQSSLTNLENGRSNPSLKTLKGVSKHTGLTIDELVKRFDL